MRTAQDFLDDMLRDGKDWIAIVSVARIARRGQWHDEVVEMLQRRGLMPSDKAEIDRLREEDAAKPRQEMSKYAFCSRKLTKRP